MAAAVNNFFHMDPLDVCIEAALGVKSGRTHGAHKVILTIAIVPILDMPSQITFFSSSIITAFKGARKGSSDGWISFMRQTVSLKTHTLRSLVGAAGE